MSRYGKILTFICLLDIFMTALGIRADILTEANPLLLWFFNFGGLAMMILAKLAINFLTIFILETYLKNRLSVKEFTFLCYGLIGVYSFILIVSFGLVFTQIYFN